MPPTPGPEGLLSTSNGPTGGDLQLLSSATTDTNPMNCSEEVSPIYMNANGTPLSLSYDIGNEDQIETVEVEVHSADGQTQLIHLRYIGATGEPTNHMYTDVESFMIPATETPHQQIHHVSNGLYGQSTNPSTVVTLTPKHSVPPKQEIGVNETLSAGTPIKSKSTTKKGKTPAKQRTKAEVMKETPEKKQRAPRKRKQNIKKEGASFLQTPITVAPPNSPLVIDAPSLIPVRKQARKKKNLVPVTTESPLNAGTWPAHVTNLLKIENLQVQQQVFAGTTTTFSLLPLPPPPPRYLAAVAAANGITRRKCVVCLRRELLTQDIFEESKGNDTDVLTQRDLLPQVAQLTSYLNISVTGNSSDLGICLGCLDSMQRWHIFCTAIHRQHEVVLDTGEGDALENIKIDFEPYEKDVYKNYNEMVKLKNVYQWSPHRRLVLRDLTNKDWEIICEHLCNGAEKMPELEKYIMSKEKLSHIYCTNCQTYVNYGKIGFLEHMKVKHGYRDPIILPCDLCGNYFPETSSSTETSSSFSQQYYHHWIAHFYSHPCNICARRYPTAESLLQHKSTVHYRSVLPKRKRIIVAKDVLPKRKRIKVAKEVTSCPQNINFPKNNYKITQITSNPAAAAADGSRPWKCEECATLFKTKAGCMAHQRNVHQHLQHSKPKQEKTHKCHICGQGCRSIGTLRNHIHRHENNPQYHCDVCLKKYFTYAALKGHKVSHQTTRDFVCDICDKGFKKKKALEEHRTLHTGEKPYECSVCGRRIRVKSNLYKHLKVHKKRKGGTFDGTHFTLTQETEPNQKELNISSEPESRNRETLVIVKQVAEASPGKPELEDVAVEITEEEEEEASDQDQKVHTLQDRIMNISQVDLTKEG